MQIHENTNGNVTRRYIYNMKIEFKNQSYKRTYSERFWCLGCDFLEKSYHTPTTCMLISYWRNVCKLHYIFKSCNTSIFKI